MPTGNILHDDRAPVRAGDPDTSQAAADKVNVKKSWWQFVAIVIDFQLEHQRTNFTTSELKAHRDFLDIQASNERITTAPSELEKYGVTTRTNKTRTNRNGRKCQVWEFHPEVWDALTRKGLA